MNRRSFLTTTAGLTASAQTKRPNIVLLYSDDQRWSTIGAWGHEPVKTPNLDRLARRGVSFDHAHIMGGNQGAVCVPSRAMLHTGRTLYRAADDVQAPATDTAAASRYTLMGEHFREQGYRTHGIGKWHNPRHLFNRAFASGSNIFFGGMSDQWKMPVWAYDPSGRYPNESSQIAPKHATETFADSAVAYLKAQEANQPFFLYTAFTSPHDPRTAPEAFHAMYPAANITLPRNYLPQHPFDNGELKVRDEMLAGHPRTETEIRRHIADYYAMISHLDSHVGRILDTIDSSPFGRNTIVVFAGDNGLAVGQHGLMGKQNVYEHSVRVPLLMAGPGLPANQRRSGLCYLLDVFPTLCDLTGTAVPGNVEGRSLIKSKGREDLYLAYRNFQRAIRTDDWKLIEYRVNGQKTRQLFHVESDPGEMRDRSAEPGQAKRIGDLTARLQAWMKEVGDPAAMSF